MTTYSAIPSGDIDPDSPITSSLVTKLRDNPIAMFEGAAGAPRLRRAALADLAPGNIVHYRAGEQSAAMDSVFRAISGFSFTMGRSGTIRLSWNAKAPGDYDSGFLTQVHVNGSPVGPEFFHSNDKYLPEDQRLSVDVPVLAGYTVGVWSKRYKDGYLYNKVSDLRLSCSDYPFTTLL